MRRILVWSLAFGFIITAQTAQARVIGKHADFVASVPDGFSCADSVTVNIRAASRNAFVEKAAELSKMVGLVRAVMGFECPQTRTITFDGYHGNRKVTTATISVASNWRLPRFRDVSGGVRGAERRPGFKSGLRGTPSSASAPRSSGAPNDGVSDAEYERAVERVLGVELELTRFPKRSKIGKSVYFNPAYLVKEAKSGFGIRKGDILMHLNTVGVKGPSDLRRLTKGFICKKIDKLDFEVLRPLPIAYPHSIDLIVRADHATWEAPQNICGVVAKTPAEKFQKYRKFSAHVGYSVDGATPMFHIRPHSPKQYSDRLGFIREVDTEIKSGPLWEKCRTGCELHLHRLSGAGIVAKYRRIPFTRGMTIISELGKQPYDRIAREYTYDALGFLPNLSANNLDLIKLTVFYHSSIARLYYWFGLNYGKHCQAHIKNLGSIRLRTTEMRNYGWGNSVITRQEETVFPVENSFVPRTVDYGNWYVHGLAERSVNKGMSKFIKDYGCTSKVVSNVRKNLLRFGLNHNKIRSKKGF